MLVLLAPGPPAGARRRHRPSPVIDKAPKVVRYGRTVRIVGHLRHGRRGQKVSLRRRVRGVGRKLIAEKEVDRELRVVFRLGHRTRSATYRLVFRPGTDRERVSRPRRVEVRPRLTFKVDPHDVRAEHEVALQGILKPVVEGRTVRILIRVDGKWVLLKKANAGDGRYRKIFIPRVRAHRKMRAYFGGDDINYATRRHERLWIYHRGPATWYGPGFYGNKTACGQTLRRKTLGVAHRTIPCGTAIDLLYRGRTITVPVIDRGPYGDADWDLTERTAERLNFEGRDSIGWIANLH